MFAPFTQSRPLRDSHHQLILRFIVNNIFISLSLSHFPFIFLSDHANSEFVENIVISNDDKLDMGVEQRSLN